MADTAPVATERLHEYWAHGDGAAKIRWGEPGDWQRCVDHLGKYIDDAKGYCDLMHHAVLGIWPAQHAEMTGRSAVTALQRAEMTSASINDLPDSDFAYIEPGGKKDSSGRTTPRSLRHFPIHDAAHVRNALSRAPQSPFGEKAMPAIRKAAKKFGIDGDGDTDSGSGSGNVSRADLIRFYPLEDIHIVRSSEDAGTDGRTVEAYAAVFGQETEIQDDFGHYLETVDPGAFNRRLDHVKRSKAGLGQIKVLYNHGRTIDGTPSERFSMPVGVPVDITAESRGLLTRTRYNQTPLADEVLENIRTGSITAQSFVGPMVRSDPRPGYRGQYLPDRSGRLPMVRRTELGLRDYGPVVFPAYSGAQILGVRMSLPGERFAETDGFDEYDHGTPPDEGLAPGDPLATDEHSARYHQHALFRMRTRELREAKGLVW